MEFLAEFFDEVLFDFLIEKLILVVHFVVLFDGDNFSMAQVGGFFTWKAHTLMVGHGDRPKVMKFIPELRDFRHISSIFAFDLARIDVRPGLLVNDTFIGHGNFPELVLIE